ncbi:RusA family crossover junction endodeoxyribonuclease [Sphingomonas oryzagri]|uniref:RusA family crossover junction endodeoxyribonuclease n=1 Tax=Sphingomonas oryzagri TaxID=3042314 RepID=A0ABT6N0V9_9SPHN|nr:RusA family crossover junction endodeoxyribonuclease [Sphingomonas oryzagri]MDH7638941.1 RusA family crossover junction endodeoxyribonuclease [Sphingomonas oryzagri]
MNSFACTLPMPPSVNNMFATYNGRRIISREYKAWRLLAGKKIGEAWLSQGQPTFDRHLSLTIHIGLNYKGDISNRIKGIEDALGESIPGFPDDRYIERIEIERVREIEGARILVQQMAPRAAEAV